MENNINFIEDEDKKKFLDAKKIVAFKTYNVLINWRKNYVFIVFVWNMTIKKIK